MNNIIPTISDCSAKSVRDIGQNGVPREISCWLIELSGLLLTHSDFLATGDTTKTNVVENVFLGKKECDVADALLSSNVIQKLSSQTPDSEKVVHFFKVNQQLLEGQSFPIPLQWRYLQKLTGGMFFFSLCFFKTTLHQRHPQ